MCKRIHIQEPQKIYKESITWKKKVHVFQSYTKVNKFWRTFWTLKTLLEKDLYCTYVKTRASLGKGYTSCVFLSGSLMILWCLMQFSTVFRLYHGSQCTYQCFPAVLHTIFFPSHGLLSHITIVELTDRGERGMNPVAMTIVNHLKEYWPSQGSNQ